MFTLSSIWNILTGHVISTATISINRSSNYFTFKSMHRGSQKLQKVNYLHFLLAHLYEMIFILWNMSYNTT